ncbi:MULTISPECIES: hypothetical protein [Bacteroides]|jgi:hypothetical protein|uniref:MarR family transcriptional regulator n=3 Tax=Bacteroides TaxID=816 RepID=A0AAP9NGN0_BACFG|nr:MULTISPECIES: hypothetical protein [Bacteroides]EFR55836.1 hypothetical protein BFAG_04535 [Bacteroides fragilis 3_1_12]MBM6512508.1 hypothetical protein [Bacteroides fragilis]MDC2165195.1 hypothetical protein [Bacteroides thetaiotaomicron]MDV6164743.1 hypothetical protein [Bacteroides hominis (ex Liu et al. 2022)]QKH86757.1 hypothetical protein FOC69_21345 [Bacteroides fragilis]
MLQSKIQTLKKYISSFLNEKISCSKLSSASCKQIPAILMAKYECTTTTLFGVNVVLCFPKETDSLTPAKLQNHMQLFTAKLGMPSIVVMDEIPSYNIQRLIVQRINFIITGKQMFAPSLLLDLRKMPKPNKDIKEDIPPFAQCLILYNIEVEMFCHTINEIMDIFNVSYSTANRAVRWLQSKNLTICPKGKAKRLQFAKQGRDLWEASIIYLTTPVEKVVYTNTIPSKALSTVISDGSEVEPIEVNSYAVCKDDLKDITVSDTGRFKIEIWKYNPMDLARLKKHVDKLSRYLSIRDKEDMSDKIEMILAELQ